MYTLLRRYFSALKYKKSLDLGSEIWDTLGMSNPVGHFEVENVSVSILYDTVGEPVQRTETEQSPLKRALLQHFNSYQGLLELRKGPQKEDL